MRRSVRDVTMSRPPTLTTRDTAPARMPLRRSPATSTASSWAPAALTASPRTTALSSSRLTSWPSSTPDLASTGNARPSHGATEQCIPGMPRPPEEAGKRPRRAWRRPRVSAEHRARKDNCLLLACMDPFALPLLAWMRELGVSWRSARVPARCEASFVAPMWHIPGWRREPDRRPHQGRAGRRRGEGGENASQLRMVSSTSAALEQRHSLRR